MLIGFRSFLITFALFGLFVAAYFYNALDFTYIESLNTNTLFFIGFFSTLSTGAFIVLLSGRSKEQFYLRISSFQPFGRVEFTLFNIKGILVSIGRNPDEDVFEYTRPTQFGIVHLCIFLGLLITISNHSMNLIQTLPSRLMEAGSQFCPDHEKEKEELRDKPGCRLIYRAFDLGYVDDLGSCAPEKGPGADEVCYLRQKDEPYLHYSYRLAERAFTTMVSFLDPEVWKKQKKVFDDSTPYLESLVKNQASSLTASPRSVHHIWTNLPRPEGWFTQMLNDLRKSSCIKRYKDMSPTVVRTAATEKANQKDVSKAFEHVFGHLVFNSRYETRSYPCWEYEIHWNSENNICHNLVKDPVKTLKKEGAYKSVRSVIRRFEHRQKLKKLRPESFSDRPQSTYEVGGFYCFFVGPRDNRATQRKLTLNGHDFRVRSRTVQQSDKTLGVAAQLYGDLGELMARSFKYSKLSSAQSLKLDDTPDLSAEDFASKDFYLSQLSYMEDLDLFLGSEWVQEREDLLELYPYHIHLYRFIDQFRKDYQNWYQRL